MDLPRMELYGYGVVVVEVEVEDEAFLSARLWPRRRWARSRSNSTRSSVAMARRL